MRGNVKRINLGRNRRFRAIWEPKRRIRKRIMTGEREREDRSMKNRERITIMTCVKRSGDEKSRWELTGTL